MSLAPPFGSGPGLVIAQQLFGMPGSTKPTHPFSLTQIESYCCPKKVIGNGRSGSAASGSYRSWMLASWWVAFGSSGKFGCLTFPPKIGW